MPGVAFDSCSLCLGPANKTKNFCKDSGSYLYHRNVRENVQVGVGDGGSLPKLTFSLSVGGRAMERNGGSKDRSMIICGSCCEELKKLHKLHQELQAVKKSIEDQVRKVDARRKVGHPGSSYLSSCVPKLQMSMAGSVVGKQNITQALQFLGNLTEGIQCPPTFSSQPIPGEEAEESVTPSRQEGTPGTYNISPNPPELDLGIMKVEAEDVKISLTPIPNNELTELELETFPEPTAVAASAEDVENYTEQDPLGIPPPPANHSTGNGTIRRKKSRKLTTKKGKICKICGRRVASSHLARHLNTHSTTAKRYECKICNQTFSRPEHLRRHQTEHSGSTPFSCDLCQREFIRKYHLQRHRERCQQRSILNYN